MDRVVVEQKLESLRRCLQRVKTKCPADADTLAADFDLQDIVSMNLSRAVHLCVDIGAHLIASTEALPPDTENFEQLAQTGVINREFAPKLKKAVGFLNIAMHHYDAINWIMVHGIVKSQVTDFFVFAKAAARTLDENELP